MSTKAKPVLGYWKIRGLAQPIRCLLAYFKIDYEQKVYEYDMTNPPEFYSQEWLEAKYNLGLGFPNLPYWFDGDTKLTQFMAILRHIARENDPSLVPVSSEIEMAQDAIMDVWNNLTSLIYGYTEERAKQFEIDQKPLLGQLSKYLGNKTWFMGDKITYVDFLAYEMLYRHYKYKPSILSPFPNLDQLRKNFEGIPAISKFLTSPEYLASPCVGARSVLKI